MKNTASHRLRIALLPDTHALTSAGAVSALDTADVILFPELVDGGYRALTKGEGRHRADDEFLVRMASLSTHGRTIIAGSVALQGRRGKPTNTSLVFHRNRSIHRYDKIHLFRPAGESALFSPGNTADVFTLPAGGTTTAGIILCFDLRFPELTRALALAGARVLFVPARWPLARDEAWRSLLKARAIENQIFVIGCNARGKEGGHSYAFDPAGRVVFSSRVRPGDPFHMVDIDLKALQQARELHDNLREARFLKAMRIPRRLRV